MNLKPVCGTVLVAAVVTGCTPTIKTQNEITVKPIQITLDVNLKVDQALSEEIAESTPANTAAMPDNERTRRFRRMMERRPQLTQARKEGLIGENNKGFLEARAELGSELKNVVAAENADRLTIFREVAKRENSTPEFVGERFAVRVAERVPSGTLLQDSAGNWNAKP